MLLWQKSTVTTLKVSLSLQLLQNSTRSTEIEEDEEDVVTHKPLVAKFKDKDFKVMWAPTPSSDSDSMEFEDEDDVNEDVAPKASVAKSAVSSEDEKGQYESEVGSPKALVAKVNGDDVEGKLKFTVTTQQHTQNNV